MTVDVTKPTGQESVLPIEFQVAASVNAARVAAGLSALPLSITLSAYAGRHAVDFVENLGGNGLTTNAHQFSFAPGDGQAIYGAAGLRMGFPANTGGPEIYAYVSDISRGVVPEQATRDWLNSPGHKAVMLNQDVWTTPYTSIGVGVYQNSIYVVFSTAPFDPRDAVTSVTGPVTGTVFADVLRSMNASGDVFVGSPNVDTIMGGGGWDTIQYDGTRSQFGVPMATPGTSTITKPNGVDTISGIEQLDFSDGSLLTNVNGNTGEAFRLYKAALNRLPDLGGLVWQTKALNDGLSPLQMSKNFYDSAEFQQKYGATDDQTFVRLLYNNVLLRDPDADGYRVQVGALQGGLSREQMLLNFSDSAENRANVKGNVQLDGWVWLGH